MSTPRVLSCLAAAITLLAGCSAPAPAPTATPTPHPPAPESVAADLIGTWTLSEPSGHVGELTMLEDGFTYGAACGEVSGTWITLGDAWLGSPGLIDPGCVRDGQLDVPWLTTTERLEAHDSGWLFTDSGGTTTGALNGRLTRGVPAEPTMEAIRPLDANLSPASLTGTWHITWAVSEAMPLAEDTGAPIFGDDDTFLEFRDGDWKSFVDTPGACGSSGRYAELDHGYVVTNTPGMVASIGCPGLQVGSLVTAVRVVGADGAILHLFDSRGRELLRLEPHSSTSG
ncbi:hypothetical protein M2152_001704 [Microbacteriaceae bacterium SG_E_30_P1]|uniref:META domain-containing protein n=1 Tax=Antiquaquibacter oligotrophicus TaxID=2880260 RepID=A0ABT6KND8_9MICO|nr:hypothetical protein [Antiquaquibacter oligotrophicus]MDH6181522.1 hypothetical protein [Antiquaquibacter oligotrophicus]UDF12788.1 hypothetical protein LH407_11580 [Antiquaquibacter oligotrophicus]